MKNNDFPNERKKLCILLTTWQNHFIIVGRIKWFNYTSIKIIVFIYYLISFEKYLDNFKPLQVLPWMEKGPSFGKCWKFRIAEGDGVTLCENMADGRLPMPKWMASYLCGSK